jgi:Chaperone of endosialidase
LGFTRENSKLAQEIQVDSSGRVQINGASGTYAANIFHATDAFLGLISGSGLPTLIGQDSNGDGYVYNLKNATLRFGTNNAERARIDSSGNLLVNQTSQVGAERVGISFDRTAQQGLMIKNTSNTSPSNATYLTFYYFTTNTGSINSTGTTTSYGTTSDYRLKENVQPMTGALAKVAALKPCTYTWKSDGSSGEGFIAHELQAVCPDAVTGEKDAVNEDGSIKPQGIDTSFLVATLAAAIQEQQAMIEELKARVAALEA